jgi:hypothetical protein
MSSWIVTGRYVSQGGSWLLPQSWGVDMGKYTNATRLAAEADCTERTAAKAIRLGAEAVRGRTGERIAAAAARLGIELGTAAKEGTTAKEVTS